MEPLQHYRARWVFPVDRPPIAGGCVTVSRGHVVEVTARAASHAVDLGDVAILPGFVNAHTHLDLSACTRPALRPASFADWLAGVVQSRQHAAAALEATITGAIHQLVAAGTTLVGDVTTTPRTPHLLDAAGIPAVVFVEVLGHRQARYEPLWQAAAACCETWRQRTGAVSVGISPHAPYSTSRSVYRLCGALDETVPRATHWLETAEEIEFLATAGGPLRAFLDELGAFDDALASSWPKDPDAWSDWLLAGPVGRWILIHCNYLSDRDIARMAQEPLRSRVAGVIYCPRTHAYFGHPPHPWKALRSVGVPVALGTDSLASNPDLAVFDEARFLAANEPHVAPKALLELLTIDGATVLGRAAVTGSITPGKRADLAIVELAPSEHDAESAIFSPRSRVVGTVIGGLWHRLAGPLADALGPLLGALKRVSGACNGTSAD